MKEPLAKDQDKFVLSMPDGMRERIKETADRNNRSMNAEIVAVLEEHPGLIEDLERTKEFAIRLRESERRLMKTIADLSKSRAKSEKALAEFSEKLADGEPGAALRVKMDLADAEARFEEQLSGAARALAASEARAGAFLDVIKHLTSIIGDVAGQDPSIMKTLAQSIRDLGDRMDEGDDRDDTIITLSSSQT